GHDFPAHQEKGTQVRIRCRKEPPPGRLGCRPTLDGGGCSSLFRGGQWQTALDDLARCVAGQFGEYHHVPRYSETSELCTDMEANLVRVHGGSLVCHHVGGEPLPELLVRNPGHHHLPHGRHRHDRLLHGTRKDVLSARDDHVVISTGHVQQTVDVYKPAVTSLHQPVIGGLLGAATGVPVEQHRVADMDRSFGAPRNLLPVLIQDRHTSTQGRPSRRGRG